MGELSVTYRAMSGGQRVDKIGKQVGCECVGLFLVEFTIMVLLPRY